MIEHTGHQTLNLTRHPPLLPSCDICVQSGHLAVRSALTQILSHLDLLALEIEELSTVELVLAEALNNIVEHAYPAALDDGAINIHLQHKTDGLHFLIEDWGKPMPDGKTPIGLEPASNLPISDLPEGGFGWFLIRDLAKDVCYLRAGNKNRLTLRIAVARHLPEQDR